ncbi:MAG: DUF2911 domain-containing protein [Flavitalea sp.]
MRQIFFLSLILVTAFTECSSQPVKSPRVTAEGKDVKITYGQPSKNGRVIYGELVPYGKVWRAGANEATEITFAKDVTFGGKPVKKGTYSLFTIPTDSDWTFILNSQLKQWGAYGYDEVKNKDVAQVTANSKKIDNEVEKMTFHFDDQNNLVLEWDKTQVSVPIK